MTLNFGNNLFPARNELIASYDYRDLIQGNAYVIFYGGIASNEVGTKSYILNTRAFASTRKNTSDPIAEKATFTGSAGTRLDLDFDTKVGTTQLLMGQVQVNLNFQVSNNAGTFHFKAILRKYNGITETDLLEIIGETIDQGITGTEDNFYSQTLIGNIETPKKLIKGETLRLTIQLIEETAINGDTLSLWLDPISKVTKAATSTFSGYNTNLIVAIPFKTDI